MSDPQLRTAQRAAAADPGDQFAQIVLAKAQLRAGARVSVPWLTGVKCQQDWVISASVNLSTPHPSKCDCGGSGSLLHDTHQPSWTDANLQKVLLLKALVGDPVARAAMGDPDYGLYGGLFDGRWTSVDKLGIVLWESSLRNCARDLPVIRITGVVCPGYPLCGDTQDCPDCDGAGAREVVVAAERYIAVVVAVAVGRVVLPVWDPGGAEECSGCGGVYPACTVVCHTHRRLAREHAAKALDTADDWLICPCPERTEACRVLGWSEDELPDFAGLVCRITTVSNFASVAAAHLVSSLQQIGNEPVRAAARGALLC